MTGCLSAGWDRIDSRPRRFVMAIGRDRIPTIHNCHGCDATQCELAASLYEQGECVRLIDIGQHGHIEIIRTAAHVAALDKVKVKHAPMRQLVPDRNFKTVDDMMNYLFEIVQQEATELPWATGPRFQVDNKWYEMTIRRVTPGLTEATSRQ